MVVSLSLMMLMMMTRILLVLVVVVTTSLEEWHVNHFVHRVAVKLYDFQLEEIACPVIEYVN